MTTILICPLGQAPGVVTGTLDAFKQVKPPVGPITVHKVVLLWLQHPNDETNNLLPEGIRILKEEFKQNYPNIQLDCDSGRVVIADAQPAEEPDVTTGKRNLQFYEKALGVIKETKVLNDTELLVSVSGGRKTMSTLTFLAAAVEGVDIVRGIYHLVVDDEIERIGNPDTWSTTSDRHDALHPPQGKYALIELPSPQAIVRYRQAGGGPQPAPTQVA